MTAGTVDTGFEGLASQCHIVEAAKAIIAVKRNFIVLLALLGNTNVMNNARYAGCLNASYESYDSSLLVLKGHPRAMNMARFKF